MNASIRQPAKALAEAAAPEGDEVARVGQWLRASQSGPHFARLLIRPDTPEDMPRPAVSHSEVKERFMRHFSSSVQSCYY